MRRTAVLLLAVASVLTLPLLPSSASGASGASGNGARTPALARVDLGLDDRGCKAGVGETTAPAASHCLFGDRRAAVAIVLVGDSHARTWLPAMDRRARAEHRRLYFFGKSACSFIDARTAVTGTTPYPQCAAWRRSVTARIDGLSHVRTVVIARSKSLQELLLDGHGHRVPLSKVRATWAAATLRTLNVLRPMTARVVIVRDAPWAPFDVPDCLAKYHAASRCTFSLAARGHLDAELAAGERLAMAGRAHVVQVDPTSLVCARPTCRVVTATGVILYRDRHHLTATFTLGVARRFGALVGIGA